MNPLDDLTPPEREELAALGLDEASFAELAAAYREGRLPPNQLDAVTAPPPSAFPALPAVGTQQGDALREAGAQLLAQGRAGLLLLNGGMATRFGGRVKGVVDALPGRSFLQLQAERLAAQGRAVGASIPLLLMNSRATDGKTREHLEQHGHFGLGAENVRCFLQSGAPRLTEDGGLYRDEHGAISVYGTGHGDLLPCLRRTGALAWARERGVEALLVANIDNLGATLDPGLLGQFAASGDPMQVEVVAKNPGDVGGAPACVDGRVCIVEGFAFPDGFDQGSIPVFNTNTLWFSTEALDRDVPLRWYCVRKKAAGIPVVQFERLVGQASWSLRASFVTVSRDRFLPVKTPADLDALQPRLRELFGVKLNVL